uniref:Uncharacterized protein n=1 Tax=viral metagenome TaxID=1070528 RepID=A0A6C0EZB2_9ZZZZ
MTDLQLPATHSVQTYFNKIQELFQKYENDSYMAQRLHFHVTSILPSTLENESKNHEKRVLRNHFLTNEQQVFIQVFLSKNQYFYLPNNNCFYQYNGQKYSAVREDDIQYQLLSSISNDRTLMQWKYKTKINIIKQIKDRHLFSEKFKPETDTIQHILKLLCSTLFTTKNQVKYFLTIIGDNILKKSSNLIFLTKPKTKKTIVELENIAYITIGIQNITHNLVTKYHENYNYENCRLLKIRDNIDADIWKDILRQNGLDLLCVAAHYSNRYGSSENFMNHNTDESLNNYTLYLKNNNINSIVDNFCKNSIDNVVSTNTIDNDTSITPTLIPAPTPAPTTPSKFSINWKNMHYMWKQYISANSLPNMMYSSALKILLTERLQYDSAADTFYNVTSKYLPVVSDFIRFWEKNIIVSVTQPNEFDNEFEIDELCDLFKKWAYNKSNNCCSSGTIGEHDVLKIIKHFFPTIEIIEKKYVLNVSCILWDKLIDINASIAITKTQLLATTSNNAASSNTNLLHLVPFDEIYDNYFNYCTKNKTASNSSKFVVSKRYFEKYLDITFSEFIEFDTFISSNWYMA